MEDSKSILINYEPIDCSTIKRAKNISEKDLDLES